jgi:lipopolysaccharide/colanic/teichoic acid biosynthesis glycosyltransferase
MLERGVHVHYTTGLHGVSHHRLRPFPLSHEPFFYVEPGVPSAMVLRTKRVLDFVVAAAAALLLAPLVEFSAMLVKLGDGGPVFFRQERVGRDGRPFHVVKLRTMRPGAEAMLDDVRARNARLDGPLFKDPADPRRTRVGSILEATSIDELPQLWNVLKGEMSLVGPRPALAHEVATFDRELLTRHRVRPGITGLWQVESRDNPRFGPYRRLDLMYVENLSLSLDLAILSLTVQRVLVRALALLAGRRRGTVSGFGPEGS